MADFCRMHGAQSGKDRHKKLPGSVPVEVAAAAFDIIAQWNAVVPFGYGVSSVILLEDIVNLDNCGEFPQMGNITCIAEKISKLFVECHFVARQNTNIGLAVRTFA